MKYPIALLSLLICNLAFSQELTSTQIDSLATLTMKTFRVPGMAVAVIKDGKIIHWHGRAKGFTMHALSDDTDFSFDFQDLHFERIK